MCVACVCLIENKMLKRIKFQIKLINSKFSKYNKKNVKLKKKIYIYIKLIFTMILTIALCRSEKESNLC